MWSSFANRQRAHAYDNHQLPTDDENMMRNDATNQPNNIHIINQPPPRCQQQQQKLCTHPPPVTNCNDPTPRGVNNNNSMLFCGLVINEPSVTNFNNNYKRPRRLDSNSELLLEMLNDTIVSPPGVSRNLIGSNINYTLSMNNNNNNNNMIGMNRRPTINMGDASSFAADIPHDTITCTTITKYCRRL